MPTPLAFIIYKKIIAPKRLIIKCFSNLFVFFTKKFKKTKNFSCISDDAMIHCRQQKSKCFYLTDKCKQFVAMIKVPLQKFRKYEAKIC